MREDSNITVIIPILTLDNLTYNVGDETINYLNTSINSVLTQTNLPKEVLFIVSPSVDTDKISELITKLPNHELVNFRFVVNKGETDFSSQINLGAEETTTEFFSILEVDDQYSTIWFKNVSKYMKWYPEVDVYLPLVLDVNTEGKFLHFTNEPVWAKDFSDRQGFLDNDSLLNYPNFQLSGSVIRKNGFKSVGGLKPTLKLQFIYEFLLRMSYYDRKMMTIPKLGYRKTNMRPGSLFHGYYNGEGKIDPVEARFWFNQAKKEQYFKNDRGIKYEKELEAN